VQRFELDATGARAVFLADRLADGELELFSVPLDASAAPVALFDFPEPGRTTFTFALAPDGQRVVFSADLAEAGVRELWSVPTDGSAPPARLSGALVPGGDVQDFRIAPDGSRVVYSADQRVDEMRELFAVPLDGSAPPLVLSGPFLPGSDVVGAFAIRADSRQVVYVADQDEDERFELFGAPLDRVKASVRLSGPMVAGGDVQPHGFVLTPDGAAVLYIADQEEDGAFELFLSTLKPARVQAGR
jgi:dipeptidyl aminopeptidase/acylaminoacyl peptidase